MARFDAIAAVSAAVSATLNAAATADGEAITAEPVTPAGLTRPLQAGEELLGVWLHRVAPNRQRRTVRTAPEPGGRRYPGTAVDLHVLLVARAADALRQQRTLGWGVRVLEDHPSLGAAQLNENGFAGCFRAEEAVELALDPLGAEEESDLWQVAQAARLPAAPYLARLVVLDSRRTMPDAGPVLEREFALQVRP